jgi:hypothetical protein
MLTSSGVSSGIITPSFSQVIGAMSKLGYVFAVLALALLAVPRAAGQG